MYILPAWCYNSTQKLTEQEGLFNILARKSLFLPVSPNLEFSEPLNQVHVFSRQKSFAFLVTLKREILCIGENTQKFVLNLNN